MKKLILSRAWMGVVLFTLMLSSQSCHKNGFDQNPIKPDIVRDAKNYFVTQVLPKRPELMPGNPRNLRTGSAKKPDWNNAAEITFHHKPAVAVPVQYTSSIALQTADGGRFRFRPETQAKLLIYKDSAQAWHAELVTLLPDTNFIQTGGRGKFSGIALVDDWWGNPLHKYRYDQDGSAWLYTTAANGSQSGSADAISNGVVANAMSVCFYIEGYNYSPSDPDNGEHWEELLGCNIMMGPGDDGSGGGSGGGYGDMDGGGGSPAPPAPTKPAAILIPPPYLPISDIKTYLKCFTDAAGATYQVSLCVDQPQPGTRTPWVWQGDGSSGSISPVDAGHSFLVLTENFPGGWSVTRNIGFYPSASVTPLSDPVPGVLNDDAPHPFDIGGTWTLNSANFFALTNFVAGYQGQNYQVNTNNCTNFVLGGLGAAHIYLPYTIGGWVGGTGVDPGDLGEDIRSHNYQGMTVLPPGTPHPTVGN